MTAHYLMKKMIGAKVYPKRDAIKRTNTFFAFDQMNEDEYAELMNMIEEVYGEDQ